MPSAKFTNLSLGPSETQYTAPANGYVTFSRFATNPAGCGLLNHTQRIQCSYICERTWNLASFIPVEKGDIFSPAYWQGQSTNHFRFIYAEGEV